MKYDEVDGPACRPTRRSYGELLEETLIEEMEESGAYVSPGYTAPWRGLSSHDPLDGETPEERGERLWNAWHDLSENPEERPERRRPGRAADIEPPYVGEVSVTVDPEIARRHAERQAERQAATARPMEYETAGGVVVVEGLTKVWRGPCAQCSTEFEQRRPVSQRQRWRTLCSDVCKAAWRRDRARDRKRRQRGGEAA
ncbi:hypothetical protein ACFU2J_18195 [Streptomyces sp. NPDC057387]|uniref:hypothetical protein n=1 Tax=Streptomyces sp. NPDC057387 TaxID=3346115 RepID=UPI00363E9D62